MHHVAFVMLCRAFSKVISVLSACSLKVISKVKAPANSAGDIIVSREIELTYNHTLIWQRVYRLIGLFTGLCRWKLTESLLKVIKTNFVLVYSGLLQCLIHAGFQENMNQPSASMVEMNRKSLKKSALNMAFKCIRNCSSFIWLFDVFSKSCFVTRYRKLCVCYFSDNTQSINPMFLLFDGLHPLKSFCKMKLFLVW